MRIIGLTGSIGMGKSTAATMLRSMGIRVFDADAVVHGLQAPGGAALPAIAQRFPGTVEDGRLNRAALGAAVFGRPEALAALEAILHPMVNAARAAFLARARRDRQRQVALDVPLLFEKGGWRACDVILVVSAPAHVQAARVLARPGMTDARLRAILASQMPDSQKRRRANVVIPTGLGRRMARDRLRNALTKNSDKMPK